MHLILGITFVVLLFIFGSNFFDPYIFKSSTYIWTISYIYLGFYLAKNFQFENIHLFIINLLLVASYFISVIYYQNLYQNFLFNTLINLTTKSPYTCFVLCNCYILKFPIL